MTTLLESAGMMGNTMNYSASDVGRGGNPIESFMGAPNNLADRVHLAKDDLNYRNFQEWRAYDGQSNAMVRTIVTMRVFDDRSFYTSPEYGLPIQEMNEVVYRIKEIQLDNVVIGDEPEEGVAPVLRTKVKERIINARRKGIAMEHENGWVHTPQGRALFHLQTKQVANSVLLTIYLTILVNFLGCKGRQLKWAREHGRLEMDPGRAVENQAKTAFILQKSKQAAHGHICKLKRMFKDRQLSAPNALYIPAGSEPYFHGAVGDPDLNTSISGEGAYARKMSDAWAPPNSFAGVAICVVDISDSRTADGFNVDPLTRKRVFGNYNHLKDHFAHQTELYEPGKYKTSQRDVEIYDMEEDRFVKVRHSDVVKNVLTFKAGADKINMFKGCTTFGDMDIKYFTYDAIEILKKQVALTNGTPNVSGLIFASTTAPTVAGEIDSHANVNGLLSGDTLQSYNDIHNKIGTKEAANRFSSYVEDHVNDDELSTQLTALANFGPKSKQFNTTVTHMSSDTKKTYAPLSTNKVHQIKDLLTTGGPVWVNNTNGSVSQLSREALQTGSPLGESLLNGPASASTLTSSIYDVPLSQLQINVWDLDRRRTVELLVANMATQNMSQAEKNRLFTNVMSALGGNRGSASGKTIGEECPGSSFLKREISLKSLIQAAKINEYIPFDFMLMRPWLTCFTATGLLIRGGHETGFVGVGNRDLQVAIGVASKIWKMHYTFNMEAYITQPLNVLPLDDLQFTKYLRGHDSIFYTQDDLDELEGDGFQTYADLRVTRPSILCHIVPQTWDGIKHLDIRGKFKMDGDKVDSRTELYPEAGAFSEAVGLVDIDDKSPYYTDEPTLNTVCSRDMTRTFNPNRKDFSYTEIASGKFGPNIYEGMRAALESGEVMRVCNYQTGEA